jgi:uncharacterized protein (DUF58 family)
MQAIRPSKISQHTNRPLLWTSFALAIMAAFFAVEADHSSTARLGLFIMVLAIGWIAGATLLARFCNGHGLELSLSDLKGDFHALSGMQAQFQVSNTRLRRPALFIVIWIDTVTDGQRFPSPPIFVGRLLPRSTVGLTWNIIVRRRGPYRFIGASMRTTFPGGLITYEYDFSYSFEVLMRPAIYRLDRRALTLLIGHRTAGGRLRAKPASMQEFIGVRDYRPGDSPRHVHLALTLRTGDPYEPIVREFEDPTGDDVCIILDTAIMPDEMDDDVLPYRFEKLLSFVAAFARLLVQQKYRVRVRAPGGSGQGIDRILDRSTRDVALLEVQLATLAPVPDRDATRQMLEHETRRFRGAVLFLSLRDAPEPRLSRPSALTIGSDLRDSFVREVVG